jgi:hypothetical protein
MNSSVLIGRLSAVVCGAFLLLGAALSPSKIDTGTHPAQAALTNLSVIMARLPIGLARKRSELEPANHESIVSMVLNPQTNIGRRLKAARSLGDNLS